MRVRDILGQGDLDGVHAEQWGRRARKVYDGYLLREVQQRTLYSCWGIYTGVKHADLTPNVSA